MSILIWELPLLDEGLILMTSFNFYHLFISPTITLGVKAGTYEFWETQLSIAPPDRLEQRSQ